MRAFFPYYGSKIQAVRKYPWPEHALIVEPFAGSASYAVVHAPRKAILCDLDEHIVGVWDYLIRAKSSEISALPLLAIDGTIDDLGPVPQEAKWLVGFWLSNASSPRKSYSKRLREHLTENSHSCSCWGPSVRDRLAAQVEKIRGWEIRQCSYADLEIDEPATWFVDPPYQQAGKHYRFGSKGFDYSALGQWCQNRPGQTIVCENAGALWLPFKPLAQTNSSFTMGKTNSEVIWCSDGWHPREVWDSFAQEMAETKPEPNPCA